MAFPPQFLDEIRTRVPLEGVIGKRVRLARRGRELLGLCPFHQEKTPSFTVNEDKGFFHCFGCGAHGDVIGFVMRDEGLSFPEAVERLAGDAGLALPARDPRAEAREKQRHLALRAWWRLPPRGSRRSLRGRAAKLRPGAISMRRGVDEATRATFRLGFAPDSRTALRTKLEKDGDHRRPCCSTPGCVIAPDDGRAPYDRFRGRLIFPICDRRGRVVAFGGRALGDGQPKYLNSPETPLFAKGSLLYGQHLAAPCRPQGRAGHRGRGLHGRDRTAPGGHRASVVAPLGTALTEQQLDGLWRLADDPVLCFDGDEAGARAAGSRRRARACRKLSAKRSLRFATLPAGQDPDTMVQGSRHAGRWPRSSLPPSPSPTSSGRWRRAAARWRRPRPARASTGSSRSRSSAFLTRTCATATWRTTGAACGCRGRGGSRGPRLRPSRPSRRYAAAQPSAPVRKAIPSRANAPCSRPFSTSPTC